jgi:hypothetical protein
MFLICSNHEDGSESSQKSGALLQLRPVMTQVQQVRVKGAQIAVHQI